MDGLLSVAPNCAQAVAILPSSRTFNCTSKTTGFPKAEIDPNLPHANKVLLQGSTRILIYMMDFFQSHQTVPTVAILPSSIFPNVQLH
jgi:hypothetical protein